MVKQRKIETFVPSLVCTINQIRPKEEDQTSGMVLDFCTETVQTVTLPFDLHSFY